MANLPESSTWEPGIYQYETSDPLQGGAEGIDNVQGKQLANRTKYLKEAVEALQVTAAGVDDQAQNAMLAGIVQALSLGGVNSKSIAEIRRRVLGQGTVVLKNKWVVEGMVLAKSDIRALHLSKTGTVVAGNRSRAYTDGSVRIVADDDYHVSVPTNEGSAAKTYWAYLYNDAGVYRVGVAETIPDAGLKLYELTVPAGDTANNLNAVTLTDRRTVQAYDGWMISTLQEVYVALPYPALNAPGYDIQLTVESATDVGAVGPLEVVDKLQNGFKLRCRGGADNINLRWSLLNPGVQ